MTAAREAQGSSGWIAFALAPALLFLALQLFTATAYGYFRDELYYVASTAHLSFGYVEHPPFSILVLSAVRAILGDGLLAIRFVPALCGAAAVFLTARLAREFGAGRYACLVAGLGIAFTNYLGLCHFYSMNAIDLLVWSLAFALVVRILKDEAPRDWILLGLLLGVGLENKISVLFLGCGLAIGLVLTPHRRSLRTRWPWIAAGLALLLFLPHVIWQVQNDWPTREFIANAKAQKMVSFSVPDFVMGQLFEMNPINAPIWIAGAVGLFFARSLRAFRLLGWIWLTVAAILVLSEQSKSYYLAAAYPPLFAAGGVLVERGLGTGWRMRLRPVVAVVLLAFGAVMLPFALPVLSPEGYVRHAERLGIKPQAQERSALGDLPQHLADQFGWEEIVEAVAEAHATLFADEVDQCLVFGQNYGQAGAVDVLGKRLGLPPAISGHNSYWLWRWPHDRTGEVMIVIGSTLENNQRFFEDVEQVATVRINPYAMPYERGLPIFVVRSPRMSLEEAWPLLKRFI